MNTSTSADTAMPQSPAPPRAFDPDDVNDPPMHPVETTRLVAAILFVITTGLLLVAWWLTPADRGVGTHQQLGLPPCSFEMATGLPCVTCGMTTSFAHTADGNLLTAFLTQPAGALLALSCALISLVSLWSLITGMSLKPLGKTLGQPRPIILIAAIFIAAWAYTITIAILGRA